MIESFEGRVRSIDRRLICAVVASLALGLPGAALADGSSTQRHAGDVLSYAIPVVTLGTELLRGERDGALQYTEALAVTLLGTEVLKNTTHVERPDHSNDKSFPSGHASRAFSAATYVHRRYGLEPALPLYLLGTYVGYTRVQVHQHRWADVAGSAGLSAAASWWLVQPRSDQRIAVLPEIGPRSIGVEIAASW